MKFPFTYMNRDGRKKEDGPKEKLARTMVKINVFYLEVSPSFFFDVLLGSEPRPEPRVPSLKSMLGLT